MIKRSFEDEVYAEPLKDHWEATYCEKTLAETNRGRNLVKETLCSND